MTKKILILIFILFLAGRIFYGFFFTRSSLKNLITKEQGLASLHFKIGEPQFRPQTITLEKIFDQTHGWTATLSAEKVRTLITTGDVIPARAVNWQTVTKKNFLWSWEKTVEVLKKADVTLINLEASLIENCPLTNEGMIFCGYPRHLEGLTFAGVDVANLANNHSGNYGVEGLQKTKELLEKEQILTTGVEGSTFREVKGKKWAFLGYNVLEIQGEAAWQTFKEKVVNEIGNTKKTADLVIVAFHWGEEYTEQPNLRQQELAHLAIDAGTDLIVGNHPHWIQPLEIYKNKLIIYAHGNFIFDQTWSEETKKGVVGYLTFYDEQLIDAEFLPVYISGYGQPEFLEGEEKTKILQKLLKMSQELKN